MLYDGSLESNPFQFVCYAPRVHAKMRVTKDHAIGSFYLVGHTRKVVSVKRNKGVLTFFSLYSLKCRKRHGRTRNKERGKRAP